MKVLETARFSRLRKRIAEDTERDALVAAVRAIVSAPLAGKKLHGELALLRSYGYSVRGQARRLIYKLEQQTIVLISFGPRPGTLPPIRARRLSLIRQGIYKG